MGSVNRAGINNTAGDIIQAIMTLVIPAINDNDARIEALEQGRAAVEASKAAAPEPVGPMVVDATPPPPKASVKKTTKKK